MTDQIVRTPIKMMANDFNFVRPARGFRRAPMQMERDMTADESFSQASLIYDWRIGMAHELANADPESFVQWQIDMGCNVIFHHAYTFNGCAWYPTKLGPVTPGAGDRFLGDVIDRAHRSGRAFHTYFGVAADIFTCAVRPDWLVPGSQLFGVGALAPESDWTDLLCARIREVLSIYPIDGILFDQFFYGDSQHPGHLQPAPFVDRPFRELFGRPMPDKAEAISPDETLHYWREVLARQFERLRDAVKSTRPECVVYFNVPYLEPRLPLWVDHPMMRESDWLFVESTRPEVVDWLLEVRRPEQRIISTFVGMPHMQGECETTRWRQLYEQGLDFFGYAFPDPETGFPSARYDEQLAVVREAYHQLPD